MDKLLLKTPIFDVVEVEKKGLNFKPVKVEAPDWITVIVECKDKFLIETQHRHGVDADVEEFVSGMVEKDESPVYAAKRELLEETGLNIPLTMFNYLGSVCPNPAFMSNNMHFFHVYLSDPSKYDTGKQTLDENESITFKYVNQKLFYLKVMQNISHTGSTVPGLQLAAFQLFQSNIHEI